MMLLKCYTQYASKSRKLSSGHRTGKGQFSFQSQRKAMPRNVQTTAKLHSSHMLAEELGRLQSMGSLRVWHYWETSLSLFTFMHWRRKWQPTPLLAWRIPGMEEPGGLPSMGSYRVGHNWSDLAAAAAHASKVMFKILQARLQQYVNCGLPDVQAGFRKGRGTRNQIANIPWITKNAKIFQKKYLLLLYWLCQSLWLCGSQFWKILQEMGIPDHLLRNLCM